MAKKAKAGEKQGVSQSRIVHGAVIDKQNTVTVFEPGDDVSGLDQKTLAALVAGGAVSPVPVEEFDAGAEAKAKAEAEEKARAEAEAKAKAEAEAAEQARRQAGQK